MIRASQRNLGKRGRRLLWALSLPSDRIPLPVPARRGNELWSIYSWAPSYLTDVGVDGTACSPRQLWSQPVGPARRQPRRRRARPLRKADRSLWRMALGPRRHPLQCPTAVLCRPVAVVAAPARACLPCPSSSAGVVSMVVAYPAGPVTLVAAAAVVASAACCVA